MKFYKNKYLKWEEFRLSFKKKWLSIVFFKKIRILNNKVYTLMKKKIIYNIKFYNMKIKLILFIITSLLLASCWDEKKLEEANNKKAHPVIKTVEMIPLSDEKVNEKRELIRLDNERIAAEQKVEEERMVKKMSENKKIMEELNNK